MWQPGHKNTIHSAQDSLIQNTPGIQPGPDLYIADWLLSQSHKENEGEEIRDEIKH